MCYNGSDRAHRYALGGTQAVGWAAGLERVALLQEAMALPPPDRSFSVGIVQVRETCVTGGKTKKNRKRTKKTGKRTKNERKKRKKNEKRTKKTKKRTKKRKKQSKEENGEGLTA